MRKVCKSIVLVIMLGLIAKASLAQPQFRFKHFGKSDGISHEFVWSVEQDSLGFIWVNHMNRLSRFDGHSFKIYQGDPNDSLSPKVDFLVGEIVRDHAKNVWFTEHNRVWFTERKGELESEKQVLSKYDRQSDSFLTYTFDLVDLQKKNGWMTSWSFEKGRESVWIGTSHNALYNYNFRSGEVSNYLNNGYDCKTQRPYNITSQLDFGRSILLATDYGLWIFNKDSKKFSRPICHPADSSQLFSTSFVRILVKARDNDTTIWLLDSNRRLLRIDSLFSILQAIDIPKGVSIGPHDFDNDGVFWFGGEFNSNKGLYRFDTRDGSLINLTHDSADPQSLSTNYVLDVMVDSEDNVWVATDRGLNFLGKKDISFYNKKIDGVVCANTIFKSKDKEFLILSKHLGGTNHNQLYISPIIPGRPDSLNLRPILEPMEGIEIQSIYQGKRHFWVSSVGSGIIGYPIDPVTGMIIPEAEIRMRNNPRNANTISSDFIASVFEDPDNSLWVFNLIGETDRVIVDSIYGEDGSVCRYGSELGGVFFYPEDEKSFWLIRWQKELGLQLLNIPLTTRLTESFGTKVRMNLPPRYLKKSKDGTLLIGTWGGFFKTTSKDGEHILNNSPTIKGIEVLAVLEDRSDRWWTYGEGSITCYDKTDGAVTVFGKAEGIDHLSAIYEGWFHETSQGTFIAVSPDGVSVFDPNSFERSRKKTIPVLTKLIVNNKAVNGRSAPMDPDFVTDSEITVLRELTLDYHHNNFSVEFSAMEMTAPEKNLYRHKLESYDEEWIETDSKNRLATYTNLPAGEYTFRVKASNHHGVWSENERTLKVNILPPPWKTSWAYTGYGLLVIGLLFLARRNIVHREQLKANLKLAKVEQEKEHFELEKAREIDKVKSAFFANISHEFRTPLTLILGPLKELYNGKSNEDPMKVLGPVIRNGQRLLRLINQLLDLSKLEAGKMGLQASQTDLVQFLKEIVSSYESLAIDKNLEYFFHSDVQELKVYIDQEKMEKVVHNLLSNAFKFTTEGEVVLDLKLEDNDARISVADTGIGIPAGELNRVFDRFYQVDSSQTRGYEGSGLGMALARELVELHHGSISVESQEGKGTTFSILIPLGKKHLKQEEIVDLVEPRSSKRLIGEQFISEEVRVADTEEEIVSADRPLLLIVEDNTDMRSYIVKILSDSYNILEAGNGKEGVEKAGESLPDLIISDIMMPEMDGYKLCELIKTKEITSHIPVILLTAKADNQSRLTGLQQRADDYLLKPFDADELKLIVRNRIEARQKMREKFSREITLEPAQIAISSMDEKFLRKVLALVEEHMEDENFSIEDFSREAGYSRMQFYRKIRALAGQTPSQFVRTIRLKRAAQMLIKKSDKVSQIAYRVGFGDLAYFNKCFKEQFGVTPGQFSDGSIQ